MVCSLCGSKNYAVHSYLCNRSSGQEVFCREEHAKRFWDRAEILREIAERIVTMGLERFAKKKAPKFRHLSDLEYEALSYEFHQEVLSLNKEFTDALQEVVRKLSRVQHVDYELYEADAFQKSQIKTLIKGPASYFRLSDIVGGDASRDHCTVIVAMDKSNPVIFE